MAAYMNGVHYFTFPAMVEHSVEQLQSSGCLSGPAGGPRGWEVNRQELKIRGSR